MNKKQKILILVALGAFVLTFFAIPKVSYVPASYGTMAYHYASTSYIQDIGSDDRIRFDVLLLEWGAIVVISVVLFFLLKEKNTLKE